MPDRINAQDAYNSRIAPYQDDARPQLLAKGLNKHDKPDYSGLFNRVKRYLARQTPAQQFEFDVALWYGYLTKAVPESERWKKTMVKRIFTLLAYGGLLVNRGGWNRRTGEPTTNVWMPWSQQEVPICSAISHTARVLVWMPRGADENRFWTWLWAGHRVETRMAASHGMELVPEGNVGYGVRKGVKENKSKGTANHFGVNICLGGRGNIHPISGKRIHENGKHGHLYIAKSRSRFHNRRGLLIGVEQSAPIDRQIAVKGKRGRLKTLFTRSFKQWVPDQYGGGHGVGKHSRFSATGGDDFSYKKNPSKLDAFGPARGHYYDGMYIDLTTDKFNLLTTREFNNDDISSFGIAPLVMPVVRRGRRRRRGAIDLGQLAPVIPPVRRIRPRPKSQQLTSVLKPSRKSRKKPPPLPPRRRKSSRF